MNDIDWCRIHGYGGPKLTEPVKIKFGVNFKIF